MAVELANSARHVNAIPVMPSDRYGSSIIIGPSVEPSDRKKPYIDAIAPLTSGSFTSMSLDIEVNIVGHPNPIMSIIAEVA